MARADLNFEKVTTESNLKESGSGYKEKYHETVGKLRWE